MGKFTAYMAAAVYILRQSTVSTARCFSAVVHLAAHYCIYNGDLHRIYSDGAGCSGGGSGGGGGGVSVR